MEVVLAGPGIAGILERQHACPAKQGPPLLYEKDIRIEGEGIMSRSLSCFSLWTSVPLFLDCLLSAIWLTHAHHCTQTSSLRLESWVLGSYFLAPGLCVWSEPCTSTCKQLMELVYPYNYIHQLPYFISAYLWTLLLYWRTLSYCDVILFSLRKQLMFVVICSIMISEF